jgi:hypothetical protein
MTLTVPTFQPGPNARPKPVALIHRAPVTKAQRKRINALVKQAKDACLLLKLDNPGLDEATRVELEAALYAVSDLEVVAAGQPLQSK